jgi:hypothetical protein
MKTKRPATASNQLSCRYGFARFYAPQRAKSQWKDPNVPEYKPNWMVRFRVGGRTWEESAGPCYPVADGLRAVKVWAETRMETELAAARAGKLDAMQAVVRPARTVMLDELGRVYLSAVPPGKVNYIINLARLCVIMTRATGLTTAEIGVTAEMFSRENLTNWVRLTQEYFRRGWTFDLDAVVADGRAPLVGAIAECKLELRRLRGVLQSRRKEAILRARAVQSELQQGLSSTLKEGMSTFLQQQKIEINAARAAVLKRMAGYKQQMKSLRDEVDAGRWQRLRTELKSGKLAEGTKWPKIEDAEMLKVLRSGVFPGVDKTTMMECNTTINTYLRCAKAVFANNREYLPGLALPGLEELLKFTVNVAAPEGHREIDPAVLAALQADAPRLAREEPQVWAFNRVLAWTAARPVVIKKLPGSALRVLEDGTGVVVLPAAKGGQMVTTPVDAECVAALVAVRTDESLIGARHKTAAKEIHNAHNAWLSSHGMTGTLKSYLLRHMRLDQYREAGGLELAAAGGGHRSTAMAEKKYTQNRKVIPMLAPGLKTA